MGLLSAHSHWFTLVHFRNAPIKSTLVQTNTSQYEATLHNLTTIKNMLKNKANLRFCILFARVF